MAPWPEHGNEPKAPDKGPEKILTNNLRESGIEKSEVKSKSHDVNSETSIKTPEQMDNFHEPCVASLDENDLKALLDEAISYKHPKDVEGKSPLFMELLHSVENDKDSNEHDSVLLRGRVAKGSAKKSRRKQQKGDKASEQNSLSEFALSPQETVPKGRAKSRSSTKTDPAPVNKEATTQSTLNEETLSEDCSSSKISIDRAGTIPSTITIERSEKMDSGVDSPLDIPLPNPSQAITLDNTLEQSQIQLSTSYNSVKSLVGGGIDTRDGKDFRAPSNDEDIECSIGRPNQKADSTAPYSNYSLSEHVGVCPWELNREYRDTSATSQKLYAKDVDNKKIDENGNSLSSNKVDNGIQKPRRRTKAKNDKNTVLAQNIEGHRSDISNDIEAILKYIESPKDEGNDNGKSFTNSRTTNGPTTVSKHGKVNNKMRPIRDKSSETVGRKGKRAKESKIHKYNSLEEISKTKLEDLTTEGTQTKVKERSNKSTVDDLKLESDKKKEATNPPRARLDLTSEVLPDKKSHPAKKDAKLDPEPLQDSEFHIVTKKQRKKKEKGRSGTTRGNLPIKGTNTSGYYRSDRAFRGHERSGRDYARYSGQCDRRKSASSVPPSDKSADSSDLDSVHSLPVSSTTKKTPVKKTSTSSGSTPQASYADIARSISSPPNHNSTVALEKTELDLGEEARPFSPETVPTVIVPLPKASKSNDKYKENLDKEYPPLDLGHDKRPKSNDMFVEFTVTVPKPVPGKPQESVSVKETVHLKSQSSHITSTSGEELLENDEDHHPNKRPPVILLHEKANDRSGVTELVFGFEVNEQLLVGAGENRSPVLEDDEAEVPAVEDAPDTDENGVIHSDPQIEENEEKTSQRESEAEETEEEEAEETKDTKGASQIKLNDRFNHQNIVDFIYGEWISVLEEMERTQGKTVRYFDPNCPA